MRFAIFLMVPLIIGHTLGLAQDSTRQYHFEFSGTFAFSYSELSHPLFSTGIVERQHTQTLSIEPAIGYFITSSLEFQCLIFDAFTLERYSLVSYYVVSPDSAVATLNGEGRYWLNTAGFLLGPSYNFHVSSFSDVFIGCNVGVGWTSRGTDDFAAKWSKPEVIFPSISLGAKLFWGKDWAVRLLSEYRRTSNFAGVDDYTAETVSVGIGLAAYF